MHSTEKQYLKFKGRNNVKNALRKDFQIAQKNFDIRLGQCERKRKQTMCIDIETMTTNNPSEFWNKIKQLGPRRHSSIPMEIYDNDGEIITDEQIVLEKWKTFKIYTIWMIRLPILTVIFKDIRQIIEFYQKKECSIHCIMKMNS